MKIKVTSTGKTEFTAGRDHAEPAIRAALAKTPGAVGEVIADLTEEERDSIDTSDYGTVTEDDGTPLWSGWLWLGNTALPAPAPADADDRAHTARVRTELPADSLRELADFLDGMEPASGAALAVHAVRNLARYAPAGKRVRMQIEWDTPA